MDKAQTAQRTGSGNAPRVKFDWTGNGPKLETVVLSDGSQVYNVTLSEETVFCRDERAALQLIDDLNEAAERAI